MKIKLRFEIYPVYDFITMQLISKLVSKTILVHFVYRSATIFTHKANAKKCIWENVEMKNKIEKINYKILNWIFSTLNKLKWK